MKAEDKVYLGSYTIYDKWDDVTLETFSNYVRYISELEENQEADTIEVLQIFSNIPKEVILQMPTELFDKLLSKISFVNEKIDLEKEEASPNIEINGEKYQINFLESLKVHEWQDVNIILDSDKFNYATILAILCRKPNEEYDDQFIAKELPKRIEMFNKTKVKEAQKLINFFLALSSKYVMTTRNYMIADTLKEEATELANSIETLFKHTDLLIPSRVRQILKLRKYKKYLNSI